MLESIVCEICQSEVLLSDFENHYLNVCSGELIIHQCQIEDCMQLFGTLEDLYQHGKEVHPDTTFFEEVYVVVNEEIANSLCHEIANTSTDEESKNLEIEVYSSRTNEVQIDKIINVHKASSKNARPDFQTEKCKTTAEDFSCKRGSTPTENQEIIQTDDSKPNDVNCYSDISDYSADKIKNSKPTDVKFMVSSSTKEKYFSPVICNEVTSDLNLKKSASIAELDLIQEDFSNECAYEVILSPTFGGHSQFLEPLTIEILVPTELNDSKAARSPIISNPQKSEKHAINAKHIFKEDFCSHEKRMTKSVSEPLISCALENYAQRKKVLFSIESESTESVDQIEELLATITMSNNNTNVSSSIRNATIENQECKGLIHPANLKMYVEGTPEKFIDQCKNCKKWIFVCDIYQHRKICLSVEEKMAQLFGKLDDEIEPTSKNQLDLDHSKNSDELSVRKPRENTNEFKSVPSSSLWVEETHENLKAQCYNCEKWIAVFDFDNHFAICKYDKKTFFVKSDTSR